MKVPCHRFRCAAVVATILAAGVICLPALRVKAGVVDLTLMSGPGDQIQPAVAQCGSDYLIAWWRPEDRRLFASRISGAGIVLDPSGIGGLGEGYAPAIAFNGTNYLMAFNSVTFLGEAWAYLVSGCVVSTNGNVTRGFSIDATIASQRYDWDIPAPTVCATGTNNYFAAWTRRHQLYGGNGVYGRFLNRNGDFSLGVPALLLDPLGDSPKVA